MVTSLCPCCWFGRRVPQSPDWWCSYNVRGKMGECGEDDSQGMVSDSEGVRTLGGREMWRSIRDGICVCVVVVLVVAVVMVLMVAMGVIGVVVLMVVVGIVVLAMVVRVGCAGMTGVVEVLCIGVLEVDCVGVVDTLVLVAFFLVLVVERVELVVGCVVGLVLWCVN